MDSIQCPEHPFRAAMQRIGEWGDAVTPLLAASFAHHGRTVPIPPSAMSETWDRLYAPHNDWRREARVLADALAGWFGEAFDGTAGPLPNGSRFHHAVAGLAALADWIGSDRRFFGMRRPSIPPTTGSRIVAPPGR